MPILNIDPTVAPILSLCCCPLPRDGNIVGFSSDHQGKNQIRIHSVTCDKPLKIDPIRLITLTWNCFYCTSEIQVRMTNRPDILRNILDKVAEVFGKINVRKVIADGDPATLEFYALISQKRDLDLLIDEIKHASEDIHQIQIKAIYPGKNKFGSL